MKSREFTINLLKKNADDLLEWVRLAKSQKADLPEDFSWYSLSSGITSRTKNLIHNGNFEGATAWSKILNEIYYYLASSKPNSSEEEALLNEIMQIRAALIMKFGMSKANPLLDEDLLLTWFFHDLSVPLETAIQKSDDWQNLMQQKQIRWLQEREERNGATKQITSVEDLKTLRKIKNKLSILKPLYQDKLIENKELGDWISIMHKLP
jgi:hypothetical protein